jgi:hypothetical protein
MGGEAYVACFKDKVARTMASLGYIWVHVGATWGEIEKA